MARPASDVQQGGVRFGPKQRPEKRVLDRSDPSPAARLVPRFVGLGLHQGNAERSKIAPVNSTGSVRFFDAQLRRQDAAGEFALNPFEARALPFICGRVLDLGCGLGNLAIAAATSGAQVTALDASPTAIQSLTARARVLKLDIVTRCADLSDYAPEGEFDAVVAIGLFMFFPRGVARRQLGRALSAVRPGGTAIIKVLIEGTTFMEMFDLERGYCLFAEDELPLALKRWQVLDDRIELFDAPGGTAKRFRTSIARRPSSGMRGP